MNKTQRQLWLEQQHKKAKQKRVGKQGHRNNPTRCASIPHISSNQGEPGRCRAIKKRSTHPSPPIHQVPHRVPIRRQTFPQTLRSPPTSAPPLPSPSQAPREAPRSWGPRSTAPRPRAPHLATGPQRRRSASALPLPVFL